MTEVVDLTAYIQPGDTVLVGQGTAEPRSLVEALIAQRHALRDVTVFVGASFTGLLRPEHNDHLRLLTFGGIGHTSALTRQAAADVMPIHLGSLPQLISDGRLRIDVVLLQVSPAEDGRHSLGLAADYLPAALASARVVIAEVNRRVPFTFGDTEVSADRLSVTVEDDRPLIQVPSREPTVQEQTIGKLVADVIPDRATIQFGVGGTPDVVLDHLTGHRDLGVHSGLLSDAVVTLAEAGALTNAHKPVDRGLSVAGVLFGSERLYRWAERNKDVRLRSLAYTHDARVLATFDNLYAINSALEVDLTGQINAEAASGRYVGAVGGQGAFARAASCARNGRSIIALPSTTQKDARSRIVVRLADGVVTTARSDADLIVTEHGVADLRGMSLDARAMRMIAIAPPDQRELLEREWRNARL
jgi:acyl-CoA hydrolase